MTTGCTVLLVDAVDRQGYAGACEAVDDEELARVMSELCDIWPRRAVLTSRSRYVTDAKRLRELKLGRDASVVVARPSALLLPASVLRDALEQFTTGHHDLAVLSGIQSEVFYVASARALARLASLGGVPGCVTLPQVVERLAGAGASGDDSAVKVACLASLDPEMCQPVAAALLPRVWRRQRLGTLLSMPSEARLAEALRLQQQSFDEARAALRRRRETARGPCEERPLPSSRGPHARPERCRGGVLVVVPSMFQSGAHSAWAELANDLSPAEVAFVVGHSTALKGVLEAKGFTTFDVSEGLTPASGHDAAAFLAALDDVQPSVVHFDGAEGNAWAPVAFLRGARVVQHVRLNDVGRFGPAFVYADAIVGVSPYVCRQIAASVGPGLRVEHIPDGVCLESRPPRVPGADGRPVVTADDESEPLLCLCVGRVEPAKGQLRVIDIFRCLREHLACRLVIVGPCGSDPAYCDEVTERIETDPAAGITWLPFRYPMDDLYRQAHVVLVGSRNEALGMVGLETLAAGGLLVAQRSTGYECIIDPARSEGLLYDLHESAHDVAARIVAALAAFPTYSASARRKAVASFDARDAAAHLSRLWREVSGPGD